jgi:thiamine-phosphate pyrophosphorylase
MENAGRACQLYLVTPPSFALDALAAQLEQALAAVPDTPQGNFIGAFQLRLEDASEAEWRKAIETLQPICARYGVAFILNERLPLALEYDVDGVHVIRSGTSVADARKQMGEDRIVGITCLNSRDMAMKAGDAGADYVAFASFYEQETNAETGIARPDILAWWQEFFVLPCVAMGGITPYNCRPLVTAGADFIVAIRSVWDAPEGAGEAVKAFHAAITEALQSL